MKEQKKRTLSRLLIAGLIAAVVILVIKNQDLQMQVEVLEYLVEYKSEQHTGETGLPSVQSASGEGYVVLEAIGPNGETIRSYRDGDETGRELWRVTYSGDLVQEEHFYPNGSTQLYSETDTVTGMHWEIAYSETGTTKYYRNYHPETGSYMEEAFYENGGYKWFFADEALYGSHTLEEYYETGNIKHSKHESPDFFAEYQYDGDGYCTYCHIKESGSELECFSDGNGRLVKCIRDGITYQDPAYLAKLAAEYNFRS